MMRFLAPTTNWRIGTSVCGGLSLIHYNSFKVAASLAALKERYELEMPAYLEAGTHVMVSQNGKGELTVGDSHEYGKTFDPFDSARINHLIKEYLDGFMESNDWQLVQSWNGVYAKMLNGQTDVFLNPAPGVYIVNGMGGAGMTLSFAFAEDAIASL